MGVLIIRILLLRSPIFGNSHRGAWIIAVSATNHSFPASVPLNQDRLETASLRGPAKLGFNPKGPCTHIVYTLAVKYSLYRYIGFQVYTIWVHGPLG